MQKLAARELFTTGTLPVVRGDATVTGRDLGPWPAMKKVRKLRIRSLLDAASSSFHELLL